MDTKQKIINIAVRSFIVHGYDKTSLNSIASELGLTKGAFYHHFPSKRALFDETLTSVFKELEVWMYENIVNAPDFRTMLQNYVNFPTFFTTSRILQGNEMDVNLYKLIFDAVDSVEGFKDKISLSYKGYIDLVEMRAEEAQKKGEIRKDIDCEVLAINLTTMVEGMVLFHALSPQLKLGDRVEEVFQATWNMIKPQ